MSTVALARAALRLLELEERERYGDQYNWLGPGGKARDKQRPPEGPWFTWVILAGRGFGKTRTGAEWVRNKIETGQCRRLALVAPTAADARDVIVEGESGILAVCPPWDRPVYEPSKRRLAWPETRERPYKAIATLYSAEEPERLRGPQHDGAWCDELCAWQYPQTWDQLLFGLRLGQSPQICVTTTPKPVTLLRKILSNPTTATTRGSTYENAANLAAVTLTNLKRTYEGTRLGRQELNAEILDDIEGALWTTGLIEAYRVDVSPILDRVVVAVDPSGTDEDGNAEQGIVVSGRSREQGYVLADLSCRLSPNEWGKRAVQAYLDFDADALIFEKNFGGEMCRHVLETAARDLGVANVNIVDVWASRGKVVRAEPVSALYEQGRVHHCRRVYLPHQGRDYVPDLSRLETQLTTWVPGNPSPDRLDALVWGVTELDLNSGGAVSRGPNPFAGYRG